MKTTFIKFFVAIVLLAFASIAQSKSLHITSKDFGDKWPFTVTKGELSCNGNDAVTFKTNGIIYGVNGRALSKGYPRINPIWKDDQKMIEWLKEQMPGEKITSPPKISIGPVLEKGLTLCK